MATNNHALIRYMTIDRCLKGGGTYHLKDLIRECSDALNRYEAHRHESKAVKLRTVSRRTILYDLEFMRDDKLGFGAPIQSDKTDGYYYEDVRFEIFRARIAPSDLEELNQSLLILQRISGGKEFEDLRSVITRLEETYDVRRSQKARPVIVFEHSSNIDGQKWINQLKKHIQEKDVIEIEYEPFGRDPYYRLVSPYLIKEYNNRWFLFGHDHDPALLTIIALDRINVIKASIRPFHQDETFDPETYQKEIIGVSIIPDRIRERIVFKAFANQRHYIRTKPLHPTQVMLESTEEYAVFSIEVIPNYELESKLLGFGEKVEVLEPDWLREVMKGRVEEMMGRYR